MAMAGEQGVIPVERIERAIYLIRGQKIMFDRDLAEIYEVSTKVLNQAVKRHKDRFPEDFMFQMTMQEANAWWSEVRQVRLRSQNVTLNGSKIKLGSFPKRGNTCRK